MKKDLVMLYKLVDGNIEKYVLPPGKNVLCAVPGAFTPGCSNRHLPGFVNNLDKLKSLGIDKVIFVSVNDPYVMDAWSKQFGHEEIDCIADTFGEYTKLNNEDRDISEFGLGGIRSYRYAKLLDGENVLFKFKGPFIEDVLKELES